MNALAQPLPAPRKPLRLALLGVGNVGRALLARLAANPDPALSLCLASNSRTSLVADAGLDPTHVAQHLPSGACRSAPEDLAGRLGAGGVVIDASASAELAAWHPRWLRQGLHVISANKLGLGAGLLRHHEIRGAAEAGGLHYGDAATVGAGLPLLRSLRELRAGGDRITAIAGVLSGTLAWLFDDYDGAVPFSARVRAAVAHGYAEPDPRTDLSGEDVRRKLLILARAAGQALEQSDVHVDSLLTPALAEAESEEVDAVLPSLDAPLALRAAQAARADRVLRYVARFDDGGAHIGLEALNADDPLAGARGCDNRVAIWSTRYRERPLVIQGPGAGAEVTAAALHDDLRRVVQERL